VIDNSVISLENIYRHLEMGASPAVAAERGGAEVNLAVLAATLVDVVDFFPVTFLYGVSKFLFSALALAFVLSLLASFVVAMTVIPLFCSRYLKGMEHGGEGHSADHEPQGWAGRFNAWFNRGFNRLLDFYELSVRRALRYPGLTVAVLSCLFIASLGIYRYMGVAFFPQTDAGQFTINMKAPTGTRIEVTEQYVARIENLIRSTVSRDDLNMIVSNIGVVNDFSSLYTTNAGEYTATIQTALNQEHKTPSLQYMDRLRHEIGLKYPEVRTFFSSGSMVDAILNAGMPAPIDVQVSSRDLDLTYDAARTLAARIRELPGVGEIYIPQDMNYPALRFNVDRVHAAELGLNQRQIVDNMITALNSNTMIAPNYWVDYKTGNDYFLTVQYAEHGPGAIHDLTDLKQIPLRSEAFPKHFTCGPQSGSIVVKTAAVPQQPRWGCSGVSNAPAAKPLELNRSGMSDGARVPPVTVLDNVVKVDFLESPTEVDHYQIQRVMDVYVTPSGEDLGKVTQRISEVVSNAKLPSNVRVELRGMVQGMNESFKSFGKGFVLSFILLYLILIAQFRSFIDPFLIMLAIPMGFIGVLVILPLTHTTLNVMSLMGVLMLVGIADSNSILIVDFAHKLEDQGLPVADAVITACRVRLRPILMTSLATIIGMIPMALNLGTGAEQYTPMARAIIGGLTSSVLFTVFIVPAAYLLVYGRRRNAVPAQQ